MIPYPNISPVIFSIGPLQVRWYGMMYLLGFLTCYLIVNHLAARKDSSLRKGVLLDFLVYAALGIVIGGRLGYVIGYNLSYYLDNPLEVFALWHGGLSFHGGFLGVVLAGWLFGKRRGLPFYEIADLVVIPLPIALGLGRVGNFINGELFGRPSRVPWCMVFPRGGPECRHPSQLYEACLEGVLLFVLMWWIGRRPRRAGATFWAFVALYGACRFLVEFTREPDPQLGFVLGPLTMGQMLSLPMAFLGAWAFWRRGRSPVP